MENKLRPDMVVKHFDWRLLKKGAERAKAVLSFTIYFNPSDRPNKYVVRPMFAKEHNITPLPVIIVGNTYEEVLNKIPIEELKLVCFAREVDDDKVIVETWL